MLSLKRNEGDRIRIGENVEVMVLHIDDKSGEIRLGITAPKEVRISRKEANRRDRAPARSSTPCKS